MRSMKLRVSGLYRQGEHHFLSGQLPLVQLAGGWLAEGGFPVGSRVLVEAEGDGRLVLTRVDDAAAARATADEATEPSAEPVELAVWRRPRRHQPRRSTGGRRPVRKELTVSRRCYGTPRSPWSSAYGSHGPEPVPFVRLSGRWLRRLGFPIGSKIAVEAEAGRLVLTAIPTADPSTSPGA